jgi:hypothetical protein
MEDDMIAIFRRRDPFWDDGRGARRTHLRRQIEGFVAFVLAVGACGLTAAMWLRVVAPHAERLLGG